MIVKMTVGQVMSPILTFFVVMGYWGLNQIAVELENPYGDGAIIIFFVPLYLNKSNLNGYW